MKTFRIMLTMLLAVMTCSSLAQGIIIYKSNGTQEKLPYVAVDSIIPYYADKKPEPVEARPVDLGLPSDTLWASHNVGATAPETIGGYYAFGETEEKLTYAWTNYMCTSDQCGKFSDPLRADGLLQATTSYSTVLALKGSIAGSKYDVATQKWGESWVMPTKQQFQELFDNCTRTTVTINEVKCSEFTGPNGNSIIFPICGGYKENQNTYEEDRYLYCWTAEVNSVMANTEAISAYFHANYQGINNFGRNYRHLGLQVRAVLKEGAEIPSGTATNGK